MKRILSLIALLCLLVQVSEAQKPKQRDAAEIALGLKKLNFLGSMLYVAAHPDDENTRLIAYFSNEVLANTAYLSMTRGDGGQNLIGPEIREYLGIIRTQELLAARRVDGSRQFFTRANDFGYSKSPEETQEIWERDEVLSDVVWTFRKFRPDVIITRFPTNGGGGHGHHTTSAILANEAFGISGNTETFPSQLKYLEPWAPKRLYLNTGRWWNQDITEDSEGVVTYDVGKYNALLGSSYSEIAAVSRTQHKSQGFGSTGSRGEQIELLEYRKGDKVSKDMFEGINTTWTRVKGGQKVKDLVDKVIATFEVTHPEKSVAQLIGIRKAILGIEDSYWREIKLAEVESLIKDCMGLYLEVTANDYSAVAGADLSFSVEVNNRTAIPAFVKSVRIASIADTSLNLTLNENTSLDFRITAALPQEIPTSQPYWLREKGSLGMYRVDDQLMRGLPENGPAVTAVFELEILGESLRYSRPVVYKWNDPVDGEQYRPFIVTPHALLNLTNSVYIFADNSPREIELIVKAGTPNLEGGVQLKLPDGWKSDPSEVQVQIAKKGGEQRLKFSVLPPAGDSQGELKPIMKIKGLTETQSKGLIEINYAHIPTQTIFPESSATIVKLNMAKNTSLVGYIHGAGDEIPQSLRDIGFEVWEMNDEEITPDNLAKVDAVVLGVRALNTRERLNFVMKDLMNYVNAGGTMVVQYNTNRSMVENFAPFPLEIGRDRVSKEEAEIRILAKDHPIINGPNKITSADFEGWVQERGLYFPAKWSEQYVPILSSNDPGEDPLDGGLLVAEYGQGRYVYTGYSWFRQLPAGVPGAFKIFANILSLGKKPIVEDAKLSDKQ